MIIKIAGNVDLSAGKAGHVKAESASVHPAPLMTIRIVGNVDLPAQRVELAKAESANAHQAPLMTIKIAGCAGTPVVRMSLVKQVAASANLDIHAVVAAARISATTSTTAEFAATFARQTMCVCPI